MGEQAGDELVREFAEGPVDLRLQDSERRGVARQLFGPEGVLGGEVGADLLDGLVRGGDFGALLGIESNTHGWSFRGTSLLPPTIATQAANDPAFWEWTRCQVSGTRSRLELGYTKQ